MPVGELVERVVHWASQPPGDERLSAARRHFEQRTAPIEVDQPDYESRIAHFLDWFVCEYEEDGQPPPVAAFAAQTGSLDHDERRTLAGLLRSQRSLFRVEGTEPSVLLRDLLTDALFRVHLCSTAEQLATADIFDGRVLAGPLGVELSPGKVFHPANTHAPLQQLLAEARTTDLQPDALLNALLGMRDRLQRFTRVAPEHLYKLEAIGSEAFSATWTHSRPP